ncbi:MAG: LolA-related protein [Burkholderiales bacterium]
MTSFYRALTACVLGLACGATSAQVAAPAQDAALAQVMRLLSAVQASTVRFSETKRMAALSEPLVLSGKLSYVRGRRIEKEVETPYRERTTIDADTMTVESPARGESRSYALRTSPAAWAFAEGLRATLGGDLATLERYYRVSFSGGADDWTLELAPRDEEMARYLRSIEFRGRRADITQIAVNEAGGNTSLMTIRPDGP